VAKLPRVKWAVVVGVLVVFGAVASFAWARGEASPPGIHNGVITVCVEKPQKSNLKTSGDLNFLHCFSGERRVSWNIRGPAGPPGPAGPAGPAGPGGGGAAVKWALVRADGGIAAQSGGITLAAHPSSGSFVLNFGSAVNGHLILSSGGYAGDNADSRGETSAGPCGGGGEGFTCPTGFDTTSHVFVQTRSSTNTPTDHAFYVAVFG